MDRYSGRILRAASRLESLDGAPEQAFFRGMAKSLRIHASLMRSASNFYAMQIVRDRNKDKLIGARPIVPPKISSRTGDEDLLRMNAYMRDELDNVNDLIGVLDDGGLSRVTRARTKDREDTFLLGPDLVDQLRKKRKTMRDHWLDASKYMVTPHK